MKRFIIAGIAAIAISCTIGIASAYTTATTHAAKANSECTHCQKCDCPDCPCDDGGCYSHESCGGGCCNK